MNKIFILLLFIFITLMSQASYGDLYGSAMVPDEEAKFAEEYITRLRDKDFSYIKSLLSEEILNQITDDTLNTMAGYFREGDLLSTDLIGSQVNIFNGEWQGNFTFEYHFTTGWNLANAVYKKVDGKIEIIGLNVYQTDDSQKEINKFVFAGKSALHYVILTLAVIFSIFILITLIYCFKTPIAKRKWLWIIFVLGGIGTVSINWTTGLYDFNILQYLLFGAAVMAEGEYSPWVITAGFPLGAIIFWFKRSKFIEQAKDNKSNQKDASEASASV